MRKACAMKNVSTAAAAAAAGLSEAELKAFFDSGRVAAKINFPPLAQALDLNAKRLEAVAGGWVPTPKNLSRWRKLAIFTTQDSEMSVNSYLVWDEATRAAALFDTGMDAQPVLDVLKQEGLSLQEIFITHTHWDHVEALPQFRQAFPQARLHTGSAKAPADQRNQPGEIIQVGSLQVSHRPTPGHAEDGVTYLISHWPDQVPQVAVVGDAIFAGSMGNGNSAWNLARQKVRDEILSLPPETLLCPGHGPLTTVAEETEHNPFF